MNIFLDQANIYAVGLKWIDVNFEGRTYQLPRACDQDDLTNFFNANQLKKDENYSFEQMTKEDYSEIKNRKKESKPELDLELAKVEAPKVLQYSFLNFIDEQRVIFISNNRVRYKNYNPIIAAEVFQTKLDENKNHNTFERGYYTWNKDSILIVELRQWTEEPSKKLYFKIKNNDLILFKLETYKFLKDSNKKSKVQVLDLSIDLIHNLPDVVQLPVCFKIQRDSEFQLINEKMDSIRYEKELIGHSASSGFQYIRKYYLQDTVIKEVLNKEQCLTW
ncbi:MAG: hypothetical protein ABI851_10945 [Saprospiraceae bacterium]